MNASISVFPNSGKKYLNSQLAGEIFLFTERHTRPGEISQLMTNICSDQFDRRPGF